MLGQKLDPIQKIQSIFDQTDALSLTLRHSKAAQKDGKCEHELTSKLC